MKFVVLFVLLVMVLLGSLIVGNVAATHEFTRALRNYLLEIQLNNAVGPGK